MKRTVRDTDPRSTAAMFRPALERALRHAAHHLDASRDGRVSAPATPEELRARLDRPLIDDGVDAAAIVDDMVADAEGGIVGSAGGRFFGWVIGGSVPAALAADWLVSAWDQNAAIYACGPAVAIMEEVAGKWLLDLLGLPLTSAFAFTTGTQLAHVTALAAARHAVLAERGWDVERRGLAQAPPIRIICGEQRHGSVDRAVRLLGIGTDNIVGLPSDDRERIAPEALERALARDPDAPTVVVLQAGELNTGAFDPFADLIPMAHRHAAWVHIDGAFGLWAKASPRYCGLLEGVDLADSWALDGHKWLNVPYDCGYAIVKTGDALRRAVSHRTTYRTAVQGVRDQIDWNVEWSRRARGVATYAALRQFGRRGIAGLVERTCRHAHNLVRRIGALPGAQILWRPTLNQGLLRFLSAEPNATDVHHAARTDAVIAATVRSGEAFFGGVTWRGMRCMRVSVCNWQTSDADVDRAVAAVRDAAAT